MEALYESFNGNVYVVKVSREHGEYSKIDFVNADGNDISSWCLTEMLVFA